VAKTNNTIEAGTRTYRTTSQISLDHKTDDLIMTLIKGDRDSFLGLSRLRDIGNFEFNTFNNVVLLTGIAYSEQSVDFILKKISEIPNVADVINELVVDPGATRNSAKDFFIKRSIESKIKVKFPIKTINYKISVINGVVFVIGVAEHEKELDLLLKSISTVRGVKEVINYATVNKK
jgi:osmotically-inducible protein OsmY